MAPTDRNEDKTVAPAVEVPAPYAIDAGPSRAGSCITAISASCARSCRG